MPASGTTGSTGGRRSWADEADTAAAGSATGKGISTTTSSSRAPPGGTTRSPAAGKGSAGSSKAAGSKPGSSKKPGQLVDKPLTFHSKIRSSGYGMVQPKMKIGCSKPAAKPVATRLAAPTALGRHITAQLQVGAGASFAQLLAPALLMLLFRVPSGACTLTEGDLLL
jgi:hypothetical protein